VASRSVDDQLVELTRGLVEIHQLDELRQRLSLGRPLRVKAGFDPTRPDLHIGHTVLLQKMRAFQELGHEVTFLVGDFTAMVGDPTGQNEMRPRLTREQVLEAAATYQEQAFKILDRQRTIVRFNSEWLSPLPLDALIELAAKRTVARTLERRDFRTRLDAQKDIYLHELLYPLLQGYDSVALDCDVELGGTDQLFNLLVGRDLQRDAGQDPQVAMTMPLLEGLDGVQKMSQSLGNYVGIMEPADEQFGKLMSIPDGLIVRYLRLAAGLDPAEADAVEAGLAAAALLPIDQKRRLAREVVDTYHGAGEGAAAEERFDRVHRDRQVPEDVPEVPIPAEALESGTVWLPRLLVALGRAASNGEARRLVEQGGVRLDGEVVDDPARELRPEDLRGRVLQVGRRWFARLS